MLFWIDGDGVVVAINVGSGVDGDQQATIVIFIVRAFRIGVFIVGELVVIYVYVAVWGTAEGCCLVQGRSGGWGKVWNAWLKSQYLSTGKNLEIGQRSHTLEEWVSPVCRHLEKKMSAEELCGRYDRVTCVLPKVNMTAQIFFMQKLYRDVLLRDMC